MPEIVETPIDHPVAWRARDFSSPHDIAIVLTPGQRRALAELARRAHGEGHAWYDLTPVDETLPDLVQTLAAARHEVYRGRGIVLLRGLPLDEINEDEAAVVAWAVGAHFGRRAAQNAQGDLLGRVEIDRKRHEPWRGYANNRPSEFHTDHVDGLGLVCVRPAGSGGASRLVSAAAIHNVIVEERPDLLPALYQGFPFHWYGEPPSPGDTITPLPVPVFSWSEDRIVCVFLPSYMQAAAEELGTALDPQLLEGIALFQEISARDGMALEIELGAGDMVVVDNKAVLHGRKAFDESANDAGNRLLFRLWFEVEPARRSHPGVEAYYDGLKQAYRDPGLKSA